MTKELTISDHRFAHLTRNEDCLRALDQVLAEKRIYSYAEQNVFGAGFVAGWQERAIDQHGRGLVTITREHYADLERRTGSQP